MMRGHAGEAEVLQQLACTGARVQGETLSNIPGSGLTIDGSAFNVNVTKDFNGIADQIAANPDIPLIVNADAATIPADALHVDLSELFDMPALDGHTVVIADALTLSGIEDHLAGPFGQSRPTGPRTRP